MNNEDVERIAELKVRQYFDHYLEKVMPEQIAAHISQHAYECPIGKKVGRTFWLALGLMLGIGLGTGGLTVWGILTLAAGH